jgi:hypothetical protein
VKISAVQLICTVFLGLSYAVHAEHRKIDVVTMYNGDRVTGEIVSLFAGILEYDTDSMNTIKIEWQEISRIESEYYYEIRLSNSDRYYGSVVSAERPGLLRVEDLDGTHDIEWLDVVEIRPIEEKFSDRIELYLSAGYNYTKASSVAQTTFNSTISYENELSLSVLTGRTVLTDTSEDDTSSTKLDLSRRTWTDREKLFRVLYANYESNDELGLDKRLAGGLGWGRYPIDNNRMRFGVAGGLQILTEKTADGANDESTELFLNGEFAAWKFNSPEMDIMINATLYPSLSNTGRVRGDTDIRIRWEMVNDLFWDLTAYGVYDSDAESENQFDYGISTGLGWKY